MALWWLLPFFGLGYLLIAFEHPLRLNKSAVALLTGVGCWSLLLLAQPHRHQELLQELTEHIAEIAGIVFFLLCAMAIVETLQAHRSFRLLARWLPVRHPSALVLVLVGVTFFLSAVIDNMTTTLVMLALLRELLPGQQAVRRVLAGVIIVAANAGGAWSPIGDVTTTMLWIGGHVHAVSLVRELLVPSMVTVVPPLVLVLLAVRRELRGATRADVAVEPHAGGLFAIGIAGLLFIPVFHTVTGLPPVFGAFLAVGVVWVLTEVLHRGYPEREHLRVHQVLHVVDVSSLLFFVGILLAVDALQSAHLLGELARWLDRVIPAKEVTISLLGLLSAVVDNVPLTAACMKMYATYPPDHALWMLIAYAVGTGGSILVIGSAAGVVAMNAEKLEFFWYLLRVSPLALLGYGVGIATFLALQALGW
ncbi:Na(+)/H(+) antiporter NhaD [bacterium HR21]|nr:Na(+)/H(+) antiporter NhaD [bacterium HR21]